MASATEDSEMKENILEEGDLVELDDSSNEATESGSEEHQSDSGNGMDPADEHQESGTSRPKRMREFAADAPARKRLDDQWTVDEVDSYAV
jgi:hypothetical protein